MARKPVAWSETVIADHFAAKDIDVVILTRSPKARGVWVRYARWDGETAGDWVKAFERARALMNLAGISVSCRYHARKRRLIPGSRLHSTRALGEAIAQCAGLVQLRHHDDLQAHFWSGLG